MLQYLKIAVLLSALFMAIGCYDSHSIGDMPSHDIVANATLAKLRTLSSSEKAILHQSDIVVSGIVTSDDYEGNFYKTLFIEDERAAAEVYVGFYDLCTIYPEGSKLFIRLKGCATYIDNGTLQIGLPSETFSMHPIDYFHTTLVANRHIVRDSQLYAVQPLQLNINQLNLGHCGRLVKLDNLIYSPPSTDEDDNTTHYRYRDIDGNIIYIYISEYAKFAELKLPKQIVCVTGIVSYTSVGYNIGRQFVITPRTEDDIIAD